jgi:hypothetical protein
MKKLVFYLTILLLLLPVCSSADYKIYLNNGSVISGVHSYQEMGNEVDIYFSTGSMKIPKKNILKIEGEESPEMESVPKERPEVGQDREKTGETPAPPQSPAPADDKASGVNALKTELNSVNADIKSAEEQEVRLVAAINEKTGKRLNYNIIQLRQLEKELEPLRQELSAVQQKKAALVAQRSSIESELKSME